MDSPDRLRVATAHSFDDWRMTARQLLVEGIAPTTVHWIDQRQAAKEGQQDLFAAGEQLDLPNNNEVHKSEGAAAGSAVASPFRVPPEFIELAKRVSHHRSPARWSLLYRMLWRLTNEESNLLRIASDRDVVAARELEKAVRRDAHKMKAFVRFRKTSDELGDVYVAWHKPDHYVVSYTAGFFSRRFDVMRWVILTPDDSVAWDGKSLTFGPGVARSEAPPSDELESLWKTYYSHIFNPARIKLKAMKAEMPMKHWSTLPETEVIAELLRKAPNRVDEMIKQTEGTAGAAEFLPRERTIPALRKAIESCSGCQLHEHATQVVFGAGPAAAKLMMVGEQPGDREDVAGKPFVGPAGELLRRVMSDVGLSIDDVYLTNAVKHFKFQMSGTRRLHVKPSSREIGACKPWLEAELAAVKPQMLVCLGSTPASVIFGPSYRVTKQRGEVIKTTHCDWTLGTYHPSALLRVPDVEKRAMMESEFRADLELVARHWLSIKAAELDGISSVETPSRAREGRPFGAGEGPLQP